MRLDKPEAVFRRHWSSLYREVRQPVGRLPFHSIWRCMVRPGTCPNSSRSQWASPAQRSARSPHYRFRADVEEERFNHAEVILAGERWQAHLLVGSDR